MSAKIQRIKNITIIIGFWSILIVSFIFFSTLIVLKANGYQLNVKTGKFIKTGMIVLDADPQGTIKLDGKVLRKQGYPNRIGNLIPGSYDIEVGTPNYQTWEKTIAVSFGQASVYDHIKLFRQSALDTNAPSDLTLLELTTESKNYQGNLQVIGSEVFLNDTLVTRFSQNVSTAVLFPDDYHLVFQIANEIRVIDLDGSNNKLLFELPNDLPTQISFRQGGNLVIYWDNISQSSKAKIVH